MYGFPGKIFLDLILPALWSLRGESPAQEQRCAEVLKFSCGAGPISAKI